MEAFARSNNAMDVTTSATNYKSVSKPTLFETFIKVCNQKMKKVPLEIYHEESNFVVLKAPGRAYPGVLIQGDSLMSLVGDAQEAIELFDSDREEALEALKGLYEELNWRLEAYMKICKENQIS